ncbi:unnamed protein product [Phytophthora lilii]|uniref:Unnamed protein product n=1 Tax=Phytophthora lilii TaxID=2077276 RepID=A0A9W6WU02_9STRA|nr:unnamed protein product [Phytophthora lilii]
MIALAEHEGGQRNSGLFYLQRFGSDVKHLFYSLGIFENTPRKFKSYFGRYESKYDFSLPECKSARAKYQFGSVEQNILGTKVSLLQTAAKGNVGNVKAALERGQVVDTKDENGWTPLLFAARDGYEGVLRLLLHFDAAPDLAGKTGWTPFVGSGRHRSRIGSPKGHLKIVQVLLNRGAAIDLADEDGWTPLMNASRIRYITVVHLLLEHKADTAVVDRQAKTVLQVAEAEGNHDVVKMFKAYAMQSKDTVAMASLRDAVLEGDIKTVSNVFANGADIKQRDEDGNTPLLLAANEGHLEIAIVRVLLDAGVAVDLADQDQWTPLYYAPRGGYVDAVRFLLKHGAGVNAQDEAGHAPLGAAVIRGELAVVRVLLNSGAAVDLGDRDQWTPLRLFMLVTNARVDAKDKDGWSPMLSAAFYGQCDVAKLLLDHGANIDPISHLNQETPLAFAAERGGEEMVAILIDRKAKIDSQNKWGETPLRLAVDENHYRVVTLLLERGASVALADNLSLHAVDARSHPWK